jgi:mannosyltransferase OCH1-like enzyme
MKVENEVAEKEVQKAKTDVELIEKLEKLEIKEEAKQEEKKQTAERTPFDPKLNEEILRKIHQTPKEKQLKFSNPIRDYCHLMSNRLVILLANLH